jgi:hypothetical protein
MPTSLKANPLARGIFFALCALFMSVMTVCLLNGCAKSKPPAPKAEVSDEAKGGEFILMGNRGSILDSSMKMMAVSTDYGKDANGVFNEMKVGDVIVPVEVDVENAYACSYVDGRRVVFYPIKGVILPSEGEKKPLGFLHYFDDKGMSIFFHVVSGLLQEKIKKSEKEISQGVSEYQVWFLSPKEESYGLVRSRIFSKSELADEEAFKKFDSSRRTVMIGTNSLDENKFLYVFLKIPAWEDKIFQIYQWWY